MSKDGLSLRRTGSAALGIAAALVVTVPGVATAEPIVRCRTLEGGGDYTCITETPTAPATTGSTGSSSSGGGLGDWVSEHAGLIVLVIGVLAAIAIVSVIREGLAEDKAKAAAAEAARGRQLAMDAGVEPAAQAPEDLRRYGTFGWAVPWTPGTAFGNLVTRGGDTSRVYAAWEQAAELARVGHWDEGGAFAPAAAVVNVNGYGDGSGDLELSVNTADYSVGEKELNRVLEPLTRTARVETASAWTRDAVRDWYVTRLSMTPAQQQTTLEQPQQAAPDPSEAWEW